MTGPRPVALMQRNNVVLAGRPDGPVLMFAHGFGCDQNMWRRIVPWFENDYRIVLFDHVGAGGSDISAYSSDKYATLDGYAEDIVEICTDLDLHDVTLVGHSVSAMIAVAAAVRDPARFSRLILVAPSPSYIDEPDYAGGFSRADIDDLLESLDNNYFAWAALTAPLVMGNAQEPQLAEELGASFCRTDPRIAADFARVTFLSDSRGLLGGVQTPALVMQCSDDALAPDCVGEYVHSHLPGSTYIKLAATGHCPHVSAPTETAAVISTYLQRARAA